MKEQLYEYSNGEWYISPVHSFFDVGDDGVPAVQSRPEMCGTFSLPINIVRNGKVEPLFMEGELPSHITEVWRHKQTGGIVLVSFGPVLWGVDGAEGYHIQTYQKQDDAWAKKMDMRIAYRESGNGEKQYLLDECYYIEDGQEKRFATQQEAADYYTSNNEEALFSEYSVVKPLNDSANLFIAHAESYEASLQKIVDLLNSLDGKNDFYGDAPPPTASAGVQELTPQEREAVYQQYLRHIERVIHDHASPNGHQMASMAVGMERAKPYVQSAPTAQGGVEIPGVRFTHSITLEGLNRLLQEVYGANAPALSAANFTKNHYAPAIGKDPTAESFGGLGSYLVYDESSQRVLIGESVLASSAKGLNLVQSLQKRPDAQGATQMEASLLIFIICRGEYRDGGFFPDANGSVYVVLDKFGETEITQQEYQELLSTTAFDKLMDLIRRLVEKYRLRGLENTLALQGDATRPNEMQVTGARVQANQQVDGAGSGSGSGFGTVSTAGLDSTPANASTLDKDAALSGAGEAYRQYYLSFLRAINALDGSLTGYCSESQRARQEVRIFKFNSEYTFENRHMYVDKNTLSVGYENGLPTVKFNVRGENDMWKRAGQNPSTERNEAHTEVVLQQENGEWLVVYTHMDNGMDFSDNVLDLAK